MGRAVLVAATVALVNVTALLAQATWAEKHRTDTPVARQEWRGSGS